MHVHFVFGQSSLHAFAYITIKPAHILRLLLSILMISAHFIWNECIVSIIYIVTKITLKQRTDFKLLANLDFPTCELCCVWANERALVYHSHFASIMNLWLLLAIDDYWPNLCFSTMKINWITFTMVHRKIQPNFRLYLFIRKNIPIVGCFKLEKTSNFWDFINFKSIDRWESMAHLFVNTWISAKFHR